MTSLRKSTADALVAMLEDLTVEQLKELYHTICPTNPLRAHSRDDITQQILGSGRNVGDLQKCAYAIEASVPQDHCFIAKLKTPIMNKVAAAYGRGVQESLFSSTGDKYRIRLANKHRWVDNSGMSITFETHITVRSWRKSADGNVLTKEEHSKRIPIIVRIRYGEPYILLLYPGYTQGQATQPDQRIHYSNIVQWTITYLSDELNIKTVPLPVLSCVNSLLDNKSDRVSLQSIKSILPDGKLSIASADTKISAEAIVSRIVSGPQAADRKKVEDDVGHGLRSSVCEQMGVYWRRERVHTRLEFWEELGTDMRLVWYSTEKHFDAVESVCKLIVDVSAVLSLRKGELWSHLVTSPVGTIFLASDLMARYAIKSTELQRTIITAINAGIMQAVYSINAPDEILDQVGHDWTPDLARFAREFRTADGNVIDGRRPSLIRVAFRRVDSTSEVQN